MSGSTIHPVAKIITTPAGVVMIATHGPELLKPGTHLLYSADDVQRLLERIHELEVKHAR